MANNKVKRLYRTEGNDAKLFGICGGIAEYFAVDPTLIRALWIVFCLAAGTGIIAYIICAFIIPAKSDIK